MLFFIGEGWVLSKLIPFHRALAEAEQSGGHILALDGLRGVLALSVFFTHASSYYYFVRTQQWGVPPTNFYRQMAIFPVSMFFFITGYLFWSKLRKSDKFPAGLFLYRRLLRLGGAYLFSCVLLFLLVAAASGFRCNEPLRKLGLEGVAWLAFLSGRDLNHVVGSRLWLGQAWSLQFEWMFYLVLPFLGWFARKRSGLLILMCLAGAVWLTVSRIHLSGTAGKIEEPIVRFLSFFLFTFSVGMVVATLGPTERWKSAARSVPASTLAIVSIGITVFFVDPAYGWLESIALALPFACVCFGNTWFGLLTSLPLRFLGRISYSFYLLHMLVLTAGLQVIGWYGHVSSVGALEYWGCILLLGACAIIISSLSYQYFEHPLLHVGLPPVKRIMFTAFRTSRPELASKADAGPSA